MKIETSSKIIIFAGNVFSFFASIAGAVKSIFYILLFGLLIVLFCDHKDYALNKIKEDGLKGFIERIWNGQGQK